MDAVIHLAALAGEAAWERILPVNIEGTYVAFEAARRAGVPRVIYASSNHAVGFTPRSEFPVPDYAFPAPDTYYGVAKVTGEALAALYHYRYGLDTICLRILTCYDKPPTVRSLSTWLSPDDAGRLFGACLTVADPGFRVAYGVSANTRGGWVSPGGSPVAGVRSPATTPRPTPPRSSPSTASRIPPIPCSPTSAGSTPCPPTMPFT